MTRIGFVGLGVMGSAMARHLAANHDLAVYARNPIQAEALVNDGAQLRTSLADLAYDRDVVITMVNDTPAVRDVLLSSDGVLSAMQPGALVIDMSTIHPATSVDVAERGRELGVGVLDAPVSGGDVGARAATLSIMVGGEAADFERALPIFELMGRTIVHVGGAGAGQVVKACNQMVVGITYAAVAEALVLGSKAGVDPARILDVLTGGLADNRIMHVRRDNFLNHDFTPGFRVDLHHKDLLIATETASELDVAVPTTGLVLQLMRALRNLGQGSSDHSAMLALIEQLSGHTIATELSPEGTP